MQIWTTTVILTQWTLNCLNSSLNWKTWDRGPGELNHEQSELQLKLSSKEVVTCNLKSLKCACVNLICGYSLCMPDREGLNNLKLFMWHVHGHIHKIAANCENKFLDPDFLGSLPEFTYCWPCRDSCWPYQWNWHPWVQTSKIAKRDIWMHQSIRVVYVHNSIAHMVTIDVKRPDVPWLTLSRHHFGFESDIHIATIYVLPNNNFSSEIDPITNLINGYLPGLLREVNA